MASKLVRTFVESLAKKVDMTFRDASSTYAGKTEKIAKEDPRLLQIYDEEDIGSAIYNSRTGQSNLGVVDTERFLDMAERWEEKEGTVRDSGNVPICSEIVEDSLVSTAISLTSFSNEVNHTSVWLTYKKSKNLATRGRNVSSQERCM